ncbi:peptidoglycan bridge formation glycyltransferase FemA/FemB family protein [Candidatus Saccharibacteria bacterium]|nr:peptidoglycan bridge formation glycyltransferase FemA/FemB family protein [Candidatus Saccharibacteria bacterium]
MKFEVITESDFRAFAKTSPYKSFMQTPEIANLREQNGWTPYYFAVKQDEKILAATMAVAKPTFLGKSLYYTPGGPLIDLEDTKLVNFFFNHLKRYIKSHNGYTLRIDPYYELVQRDRDGQEVPGGFSHKKAITNLINLGFKTVSHSDQPKYLFALDIEKRTPDELLASFKRNTRNHIRKAEKMGVEIRELTKDELPILKKITESTSFRRGFTDRPLSYYEQMYDLFSSKDEVKFIVAEANDTPLSAAMFMTYGDEVIYLFSGSDEKYMKEYNAQYLIQWYMIKYAAEHNFERYNFYGINGLPDPASPDYGIYSFKKGFGGQVIELIGTFDLVLSPLYYLHDLLQKTKAALKH